MEASREGALSQGVGKAMEKGVRAPLSSIFIIPYSLVPRVKLCSWLIWVDVDSFTSCVTLQVESPLHVSIFFFVKWM